MLNSLCSMMKDNECEILQREKWMLDVRSEYLDRSLSSDRSIGSRETNVQRLISLENSSPPDIESKDPTKSSKPRRSYQNQETIQLADGKDEVIIEGFIISAGRLIIRTINNLSSELLSVNDKLHREKDRNESSAFEIDRLRAMMRVSSGDGNEYRERIKELGEFIRRINQETLLLKITNERVNSNDNLDVKSISVLKSLMHELRTKLRNDRDALFSGGNQWCSMYVKNVRRLESLVESLLLQLDKVASDLRFDKHSTGMSNLFEYQRGMKTIEQLVKRVAYELGNLTTMPVKNGSPVGSQSCTKYSKKIDLLEKLVTCSMTIVGSLIVKPKTNEAFKGSRVIEGGSRCRERIGTLEVIAKKLVFGIKQLERFVAAGDGAYLLEKNRQLESSVKRSRNKLLKSQEDKDSLALELTGAKISYVEKSEALDKIQKKYDRIAKSMKKRGESLDSEEQMTSVLGELEQSKFEVNVLRDEVNRLKPEVVSARAERASLLNEIENIRCVVVAKDEEIAKITRDKNSKEVSLAKEENELQSLKNEISKLKHEKEINEIEAKTARESLDSQIVKYSAMENNLCELKIDKTKIEQELSCLKKQNEALVGCLNFEKTTHSKTLQDFKKLIADFRSLTNDLSSVETDKKNLQKAIDDSAREKTHLRAQIDSYHRKNLSIESESSCLRSKLDDLERTLTETKRKNQEINQQLIMINEKSRDQAARLALSIKENEKLNNELDKSRCDKLDIAGALNEAKYNRELTKGMVTAKIKEAKIMEEKLSSDLQALRNAKKLAQLEIDKLLEAIEVANSENTRMEKRVKDIENDCHELQNQLSILNAEKEELTSDSLVLKKRVKESSDELAILRKETEKNVLDRAELGAEHRTAIAELREKLAAFEAEGADHVREMTRIRDENSALKRDYGEMACENGNLRSAGKKGEINRLTDENEALKLQLSKLRIFISEADREVAKKEMERMCAELVQFRTENTTLKKLRNRKRIADDKSPRDCRKLEDELNAWKLEYESLQNSLESARKKIAIQDEKSKDIETERDMLKGSIEGLKERYKQSRREIEDARLRNEALVAEMSELNKNLETTKLKDSELRQQIENLRQDLKNTSDENSKMKKSCFETERELVALKDELAKLRTEKVYLSAQCDAKNTDSRRLEVENASVRRELEETRCARILAIEEANELRSEREKLASLKITLESKLIDAQKEIGKYVVATDKLNDLENKLKNALKSYVITKKLLRSANEEIGLLKNFPNPYFRSCNYGGKIEAT